jgi:hypothetical protein
MATPVTNVDENGRVSGPANAYAGGAIAITGASGNVANAPAVATLTSVAGKTAYISGFEITGSGATAGLPVSVTVVGLAGGTLTYTYSAAVGVLAGNLPLVVDFLPPLPASGQNVNIVVTCPALGAGNTNNTIVAHGYNL